MKAKGGLSYLPNMVTFTSIFLGLLAILWAPTSPYAASIALIFAAICDLLDGMLARMIGVESEFGVEIDSLADFLSSGVAPAILMYYWCLNGYVVAGVDLYLFVCFAYVLGTGGRLARFNIQTDSPSEPKEEPEPGAPKKLKMFSGIPAPGGCLLLVTVVMTHHELKLSFLREKYFLIPYVLVVAGLMLSNIPYRSFKSFKTKIGPIIFGSAIIGGLSVLAFGGPGGAILLSVMLWYVASGLFGLVTGKSKA